MGQDRSFLKLNGSTASNAVTDQGFFMVQNPRCEPAQKRPLSRQRNQKSEPFSNRNRVWIFLVFRGAGRRSSHSHVMPYREIHPTQKGSAHIHALSLFLWQYHKKHLILERFAAFSLPGQPFPLAYPGRPAWPSVCFAGSRLLPQGLRPNRPRSKSAGPQCQTFRKVLPNTASRTEPCAAGRPPL